MNTSMHTTEVRDYVAQVRAALSDLPVEDVEEVHHRDGGRPLRAARRTG